MAFPGVTESVGKMVRKGGAEETLIEQKDGPGNEKKNQL